MTVASHFCLLFISYLQLSLCLFFQYTASQAKGYLGARARTGGSWEDQCASLLRHRVFGTGCDPNGGLQRSLYQ